MQNGNYTISCPEGKRGGKSRTSGGAKELHTSQKRRGKCCVFRRKGAAERGKKRGKED